MGTKGKLTLLCCQKPAIGERGREMEKESMNWTLAKGRSALSCGHFFFFFFLDEEKLSETLYQARPKKINKPSVPLDNGPILPDRGRWELWGTRQTSPSNFLPSVLSSCKASQPTRPSWPFLHRRRLQTRDSHLSGKIFEGWLELQ